MRLSLAFALTLAIAAPANAQIDDDLAAANRIFGQTAPAKIIVDMDGEWLPLGTLANLDGADPEPGLASALLGRICGNDPLRGAILTALDEASFEMVAANSGGELVYRFDWIGGSQFHRSFDPAALFGRLGVDTIDTERAIETRTRALQAHTGPVHIYRMTDDLFVLAEPQRVEFYGRCPS
jgi:hypothetical protein